MSIAQTCSASRMSKSPSGLGYSAKWHICNTSGISARVPASALRELASWGKRDASGSGGEVIDCCLELVHQERVGRFVLNILQDLKRERPARPAKIVSGLCEGRGDIV